jgi:hypothetical protein
MTGRNLRRVLLLVLLVALVTAGALGWTQYRRIRAGYDDYRSLLQQGVKVAGVDVGWHNAKEAQDKVWEWVAKPYYRDVVLHYQDQALTLSPEEDLDLAIPIDDMVGEAQAASHQYDYWEGFKLWVQDEAETLDLDVPLEVTWDPSAAARFLTSVAEIYDIAAVEPMVNVQTLTFIPGRPGWRLEIEPSAAMINELVPHPEQRDVPLEVSILEPDHNPKRIESMLSTLGPVMERAPTPPHFYTATVPISTTGGIEGMPTVSYTGELTWTFPHFVSYTGHLTSTYGFFFDPGEPGFTFDVDTAVHRVQLALQAGLTEPITFEPDLVPPPPITPAVLIPPLEARLAQFPGVTCLLVKDLDSDEVIYESNVDYVLSGMSIVKIGIMVEVYRTYGGEVDAQTHQELLDMLGSESCNPCANRLLAAVGGGSAYDGAAKVTNTMRRLGLSNFYLCAPFRIVELDRGPFGYAHSEPSGQVVWAMNTGSQENAAGWALSTAEPVVQETSGLPLAMPGATSSPWLMQAETPRYDRCVRSTPREMANLLDMIYACTKDRGLLRDAYPNIFRPQVCEDMIDIMAANDLRNLLGAGIPAEVKMAHKHGFAGYGVSWGDTRGEVGIVFSPGGPWLISFYIWEDTPWINFGVNQPLYRDISNMLYNYFNPEQPYWPLPPWAPPPEEETDGSSAL